MKKRLFGTLLSLALMMTLMTLMSAMAYAKDKGDMPQNEKAQMRAASAEEVAMQDNDPENVHLWIGSIPVTESGPVTGEGITGDINVAFDENGDATLMLSNASIRGEALYEKYGGHYYANVHSAGINLTLVLTGTNTIDSGTGSEATMDSADYAIDVNSTSSGNGNLSIEGSGSLAVNALACAVYTDSDCEIKSGKVTATTITGNTISANRDCIISGGEIEASSESGMGIRSMYDVKISGGKVSATSKEDICIFGFDNVVISGGTVNAKADQAISKNDFCAAICAYEYDLTISGDDTVVTAEIIGSSEGRKINDLSALIAFDDLTISDGKVNASASKGRKYCDAIYAEDDLKISDARVTAVSDSGHAISAVSVDITYTEAGKRSTYVDARVEASNPEYMPSAIAADPGKLFKSDNLAITTPKGGVIGNYQGRYDTIMDGDKYADHAVIQPAVYKVTVADTTDGKAEVEPETAAEGEEVRVIAAPDEGYEIDKIIIVNEDGEKTDITQKSAFTMGNSNVTVKVTFKRKAAKPVSAVRGIAKGKRTLKFTWNKVDGAASYEIWMSKCNTSEKKRAMKKVKTLNASKTTWTKKKLKKKTAYKFRVIAKDASGNVISKSLAGHAVTGNVRGGCTNAKSLKVSQSSYALTKGGTAKIKATQKKAKKGKKLLDSGHGALLRYTSNNPYVAKVDKSGRITAVGSGSCIIYVQTVNGIWKTVKVNVN